MGARQVSCQELYNDAGVTDVPKWQTGCTGCDLNLAESCSKTRVDPAVGPRVGAMVAMDMASYSKRTLHLQGGGEGHTR